MILWSGYSGHHGFHGKRSADAAHGYPVPECEKETKEICKQVPVKEEVSKDIDRCTRTPKEVDSNHYYNKLILKYEIPGL